MKKGWWEGESLADVRKGMRCAKLGTNWIEIDLERHKADQAVVEAAIEWMSVRDGLKEGRLTESISSLILAIKKHPDYKEKK